MLSQVKLADFMCFNNIIQFNYLFLNFCMEQFYNSINGQCLKSSRKIN
jgi:hypothetical protein